MSAVFACKGQPTVRHGPALNAGTEGSPAFTGECLQADVVGGVRIKAQNCEVGVGCAVGSVLLTVDVPVHDHVVDDLAIPFSQQGGFPGQLGTRLGQSSDFQVQRKAWRHVLRGAYFLYVGFAHAGAVASAEAKNVGGSFVQAGSGIMVVSLSQVTWGEGSLLDSFVLQQVAYQLTHHLFRWLPLNQCGVAHGGADQHCGFARNWTRQKYELRSPHKIIGEK